MAATYTSLCRAFKSPRPEASEVPALVAPETWRDAGRVLIGPKRYGFRSYPGHLGCVRVVRLFTDDGFGGDSYDVSLHADRPALCTCADFVYRRKDETGRTCKHVRAVAALGLGGAGA